MNTKQKCGYMILGAVIGIAGLAVGLCVSPLIAKLDTFDEIVCNRLIIAGPDNRNVMLTHAGDLGSIGGTIKDYASLKITDTANKSGAVVFDCSEYFTTLRVYNKNGRTKIKIGQYTGDGGVIQLTPVSQRGGIMLSASDPATISLSDGTSDGAVIKMEAFGYEGRVEIGGNRLYDTEMKLIETLPMIIMRAGAGASDVTVLGENLDRGVKLPSGRIGVTVHGDDEEPRVTMQNTEQGGRIDVYGKTDDVARVSLGINEYGHGAVSTWEKNGYRQR